MKCIIVDDEYKSIELLKGYIGEIPFLHLLETFRNPVEAFAYVGQVGVELVFLDINMPRLTGVEFARLHQRKPLIIFTTAYSQYAVDGFELDAVDYLLKPITFERFLKAANKARSAYDNSRGDTPSEFVLIKSGSQTHHVKRADILYIEKDANYATIHTAQTRIVTRSSFEEVMAVIGGKDMVRVHKSFIVNINHVTVIEAMEVTIGKTKIPIGLTYRAEFLGRMGTR